MDIAQKFGVTFLRAAFGDKNTAKESGAPERIRTTNLLIRSQMLYPVELRAQIPNFQLFTVNERAFIHGAILRSSL